VGLNSLKSLNLTNGYPNNKNNKKNNNKVKSKPLELCSRVKRDLDFLKKKNIFTLHIGLLHIGLLHIGFLHIGLLHIGFLHIGFLLKGVERGKISAF
jgi:hypothetical protein